MLRLLLIKRLFLILLVAKTLAFSSYAQTEKVREHGFENLAIGKNAMLLSNTLIAVENVAIGEKAMEFTATGKYNTAVGPWTLRQITTGEGNTALGNYTLIRLTSGSRNVAIGQNALSHIVDGSYNIALGSIAGFNLGAFGNSNNIFIGNNAGHTGGGINTNWNGSNNVILGGWSPASNAVLNNTMVFATGNGIERLRVTENGNLLLGASIEHGSQKLQVIGNISSFANEGREVCSYLPDNYTIGDIVSGHAYKWYNDTWRLGNIRSGATPTEGFGISLNNDIKFKISPSGNVGIGTISPTETLSVNGGIKAKAVKVEPAAWPDYVFESNYKLPTLRQTAKFIKEYGHLPEIPSAKEVAEQGIELGAMNVLLLKKIEELTLHVIEQQKQIEELKNLIE